VLCVPGQPDRITFVLCGGVGMRLNKQDILLMVGTGLLIIMATEMLIWAITGDYAILKQF